MTAAPGIELERVMDTMDRNTVEGHGVVRVRQPPLPASAVLRRISQTTVRRCAARPAHHCMRWLGAAARA